MSFQDFILSATKWGRIISVYGLCAIALSACTDYVGEIDNDYEEWTFLDSFKDSRDGQTYKTVVVGTQTWMAQNLNYKTDDSYCYDDDDVSCSQYGRLYTWDAAMNACPDGWHLPTDAEWEVLRKAVDDGSGNSGTNLKSGTWGGADAIGFSAFLAGYRDDNGNYGGMNYYADFWSSSEHGDKVGLMYLHRDSRDMFLESAAKGRGYSVRCILGKGQAKPESDKSSSSAKSSSSGKYSSSERSSSSMGTGSSGNLQEDSSSSQGENDVQSSSSEERVNWSYLNPEITYDEVVDERDGTIYKTVKIGDQTWLAENLRYETSNSFCYKDDTSYCRRYGMLYKWSEATTVCLSGWRLPSKSDFENLILAVGGEDNAGRALKSIDNWNVGGNGILASNDYGFTALAAGYRHFEGKYESIGGGTYFWSSTEYDSDNVYDLNLYYNSNASNLHFNKKENAFSVRCLID